MQGCHTIQVAVGCDEEKKKKKKKDAKGEAERPPSPQPAAESFEDEDDDRWGSECSKCGHDGDLLCCEVRILLSALPF